MITYRYVISDKQGLHARNAITFSRAAAEYESSVQLSVDGGKNSGWEKCHFPDEPWRASGGYAGS